MAQVDSENTTAMPVDPTRRRFITIAAAGAAAIATTAPGIADVAEPDPIYAAFDAFRRAHALFFAEFDGDIPDEIGDQYGDACSVMRRTRPTTPAGLAVLTTWAREQADWLCANSSVLHSEDYCAIAASIDDATRGMSGLKPWSPPRPAAMAVSADPAFALIAGKRAADVAHCEAIDAQDEAENGHEYGSAVVDEAWQRCCDACKVVNEADWRLATMPPTTLAGVAAVLRFANEIEDGGMEWPDTDAIGPDDWHYQLRATMAAAVEAIIRQRGG